MIGDGALEKREREREREREYKDDEGKAVRKRETPPPFFILFLVGFFV